MSLFLIMAYVKRKPVSFKNKLLQLGLNIIHSANKMHLYGNKIELSVEICLLKFLLLLFIEIAMLQRITELFNCMQFTKSNFTFNKF